jgi:hypothetical protein
MQYKIFEMQDFNVVTNWAKASEVQSTKNCRKCLCEKCDNNDIRKPFDIFITSGSLGVITTYQRRQLGVCSFVL